MTFKSHGRHLIAGKWVDGDDTGPSEPTHGPSHRFAVGRVADVNAAATAAGDAFWSFAGSTRAARADLLTAIIEIGIQESRLPKCT